VEQHFSVIERMNEQPASPDYFQPPYPTRNQKSFVSLTDGIRGFTLINRGLTEYEVTAENMLALTLLRAVGDLSRADLLTRPGDSGPALATPEAQCLREITWEYALYPHAGDHRAALAYRQAHAFNAPLYALRGDELLTTDDEFADPAISAQVVFTPPGRGGELPDRLSLLALDADLVVLSAVKEAEHFAGLVARVYSLDPRPLDAVTLSTAFPLRAAFATNLNEEVAAKIPLSSPTAFSFAISYGEIKTFLLMPEEMP